MEALSVHDQRYLHEFPLGLFVEPEFCELIVGFFIQSDEWTVFIEEHHLIRSSPSLQQLVFQQSVQLCSP